MTAISVFAAGANAEDEADYLLPPPPSAYQQLGALLSLPARSAATGPTAHSTISLLVLHDPTLPNALSRTADLVAQTNAVYQQSGIALTFNVAATVPLDTQAGSNSSALSEITNSSEVAQIRALFGADMVTLIRPYNRVTHGGCGIAWVIGNEGFDPFQLPDFVYDYAFSVVSSGSDGGSVCTETSLAHELGHNLGAVHERGNTSIFPRLPYAYGWGFEGSFGTVMSYINPDVPYFSTPELGACNGFVCGDAAQADVVRAINEVRDHFAALDTDRSAPEAPVIDSATALVDAITLEFTAGDDGGSPVGLFTAACGNQSTTGSASPITVTGLLPETAYACTVSASNAIGSSTDSASVAVNTLAIPSPTIQRIDAGDEELTVYIEPAAALGSYSLQGYTVNCGGISAFTETTSVTLTGLTNDTRYDCDVVLLTSLGTSSASPIVSAEPEQLSVGISPALLKAALDSM